MREAIIAGLATMLVGFPIALWALIRVGTRKPTPIAARTTHPSSAERRDERP